MFAFVAALVIIFIVAVSVVIFVIWAVHEHIVARKYRYLIRLHHALPKTAHTSNAHGPQWTISYKTKGKVKSVTVEAETEPEALQKFVRDFNIRYDQITGSVKV